VIGKRSSPGEAEGEEIGGGERGIPSRRGRNISRQRFRPGARIRSSLEIALGNEAPLVFASPRRIFSSVLFVSPSLSLSLSLSRLVGRMSVFIGATSAHYSAGVCVAGWRGEGDDRVGNETKGGRSRSGDYVSSDHKLSQPYLRYGDTSAP